MANHVCITCGQDQAKVRSLIQISKQPLTFLCSDCSSEIQGLFQEHLSAQPTVGVAQDGQPVPRAIVAFLNDYVIGQDKAKKTLAIAVYNHYKRLRHQEQGQGVVEIAKSNILMLGPTGTGKTLLAQSIARLLDVPFAMADATSLTQAGYVGDDVETILARLIQAAGGDVKKAERGIVFLDEIDKIAAAKTGPSITRDVSGEGVQQALLKMVEGAVVNVPEAGNRKHPNAQMNQIDTRNILFICAGAFVALLDKLQRKPEDARSIGFLSADASQGKGDDKEMTEYLKEAGMIPELIGRLPVVTVLDPLDQTALERILTEPKNAIVRQMEALLKMDGATLRLDEGAVAAIAARAIKQGTGARGARSILEGLLEDALFEVPGSQGAEVVVHADLKVEVQYPQAEAA